MTENEKNELDKLRQEGKLITGKQCKKLMTIMFAFVGVACFTILVSFTLVMVFHKNSLLLGIFLAIGMLTLIVLVFFLAIFFEKNAPKTRTYFQTKRKFPEYFT